MNRIVVAKELVAVAKLLNAGSSHVQRWIQGDESSVSLMWLWDSGMDSELSPEELIKAVNSTWRLAANECQRLSRETGVQLKVGDNWVGALHGNVTYQVWAFSIRENIESVVQAAMRMGFKDER